MKALNENAREGVKVLRQICENAKLRHDIYSDEEIWQMWAEQVWRKHENN